MKNSSHIMSVVRINPRVIAQNLFNRLCGEPLSAEEMNHIRGLLADCGVDNAFTRLRHQLCRRELKEILDRI